MPARSDVVFFQAEHVTGFQVRNLLFEDSTSSMRRLAAKPISRNLGQIAQKSPHAEVVLGRSEPVALVAAEIGRHSLRTGQLRHIEVQIHPVDAFQLQDDTSRLDGSIGHFSRDAAMLLQPDTTLSQRPKESHEQQAEIF